LKKSILKIAKFKEADMEKYLFTVCFISLLISCDIRRKDKIADDTNTSAKQIQKALQDSTAIQLIDSVFHFGNIKEGDKVAHSFTFKNIGNKPLIITDAHASCGCTVPEKPEKPIAPGEIGEIKVVFNSSGKQGHQEKNITVNSNAKPHFTDLKLIGEVIKGN
jgi:hypothetical protein